MKERVARAIRTGALGCTPVTKFEDLSKSAIKMYLSMATAAIVAALPHIKEAMEYHGVQGAMNKMIMKRIEDQLK